MTLGGIRFWAVAVVMLTGTAHAASRAYVSSIEGGTVSVVDTLSNTVNLAIPVGSAAGVTHLPDGSRVYVGSFGGGSVAVINTATDSVVAGIPVGTAALGLAALPDGSRVYANDPYAGIQVIDTGSNTVTTTIALGAGLNAVGAYGIAIHPSGNPAYVTDFVKNLVHVVDTGSETITTTVAVGDSPTGIDVLPNGSRVYVANRQDGTVSVIDTGTDSVTATIPVGTGPAGVRALPDSSYVYVANFNSGTVSVIDTSTDTVTATVSLDPGAQPFGLDTLADGSAIYVANSGLDEVAVIDTASNTATTFIPVDAQPIAFGDFIVDLPDGSLCDPSPNLGCETGFQKGLFMAKENVAGKEKLLAKFIRGPALAQGAFGNPLDPGGTSYALCIYNSGGTLVGELEIDRAGDTCSAGVNDCWKAIGGNPPNGKGYKFKDAATASDGVFKMTLKGGDPGKSKALVKAKNKQSDGLTFLPTGIAAGLSGGSGATVQLISSDADCISMTLTVIKMDDPDFFKVK
jgi:YVTN family beta-propeller protein